MGVGTMISGKSNASPKKNGKRAKPRLRRNEDDDADLSIPGIL
jgi:hypothetical protein